MRKFSRRFLRRGRVAEAVIALGTTRLTTERFATVCYALLHFSPASYHILHTDCLGCEGKGHHRPRVAKAVAELGDADD